MTEQGRNRMFNWISVVAQFLAIVGGFVTLTIKVENRLTRLEVQQEAYDKYRVEQLKEFKENLSDLRIEVTSLRTQIQRANLDITRSRR